MVKATLLPPQWKPLSFGCLCDGGMEGLRQLTVLRRYLVRSSGENGCKKTVGEFSCHLSSSSPMIFSVLFASELVSIFVHCSRLSTVPMACRIVLIKTCLASIPVYLLSFFKFPRWTIDLINSHMANCFWDDYEGHRKLHLANWHLIYMKKGFGGVEILDLRDLNLYLLGSWVQRFIADEGKL
jgi:hypothetical protein